MDPNRTHRVYQCVQVCMCKTNQTRSVAAELMGNLLARPRGNVYLTNCLSNQNDYPISLLPLQKYVPIV